MDRVIPVPKKTQKTRDPGAASVDALREAFEKIQAATGVDDLAVLVNNFIKGKRALEDVLSLPPRVYVVTVTV